MGHVFAARRVGGDANEVLLWPLGGLASCDVPHNPKAHFITACGGPLVNLLICLASGLAMIFLLDTALRPTWNPLWYPYRVNAAGAIELVQWDGTPLLTANPAALLLARLFWVSWVNFLFNVVLIGFPMDGGRIFQSALWPFLGYRQATLYAVFAGFVVMFVLLVVGIVTNEVLLLFLAYFIYTACKQEWIVLETGNEESLFGYDFSQGYTSLERDEAPPPQPKKPNFIQRWLKRRAQRKQQEEQLRQQAEERRMDELLEKIQRYGKESLTAEEHRFLLRVSDRYRKK
jgi:Zn-dependent protease